MSSCSSSCSCAFATATDERNGAIIRIAAMDMADIPNVIFLKLLSYSKDLCKYAILKVLWRFTTGFYRTCINFDPRVAILSSSL